MKSKSVTAIIAAKIRDARIASGWSQADLAKKLGYESPQFVSLIERGVSKVPIVTLGKICRVFSLDKNEFADILIGSYKETVLQELEHGEAGK